jgi:DNA-binding LytR/AlgR family response regulator
VAIDEILYIEGAGNYMTFFTLNKKIMSLFTMNQVMQILPSELFIRIHKSYIISIRHIEIIEKTQVVINKKPIPIGITYREHFSKIIKL